LKASDRATEQQIKKAAVSITTILIFFISNLHLYSQQHIGFIRNKVERIIILPGFPLKTCGNDEQKKSRKMVILGLDPGIQDVFHINTKDTKKIPGTRIMIRIKGYSRSVSLHPPERFG
jgi:hypothetical protein